MLFYTHMASETPHPQNSLTQRHKYTKTRIHKYNVATIVRWRIFCRLTAAATIRRLTTKARIHEYNLAANVTTGRSAKNRRKMNQQPANSNA